MSELSIFSFPTGIRYGVGSRAALAEFREEQSVRRPLLVTDSGLIGTDAFSLVAEQVRHLWPDGFTEFLDVHPNPLEDDVERGRAAYVNDHCDGVVEVGGGSALDAAKVIRARVALPNTPLTEIRREQLPRRLAPFCALPTTAGTGSEVGRSSVITVPALGRKIVIGGPPLLADMAILDPELTVGLPPHLTAATGMDAMTHAIEAYVCPVFHPMCDAIALEAISIVCAQLPKACTNGADLDARGLMQLAAAMGAVAFQKDLGVAHSLAHLLSSEFGVHHGLANALVLPSTIRFNGETDATQYTRVATALGLVPGGGPAGQVAAFLDNFNRSLGITQRLRDLGVPRDALPLLSAKAMEDGCHLTNPRRCSQADMLRLYEEVW